MSIYRYEYAKTFCGNAGYALLEKGTVKTANIDRYGYDGSSGYVRASKRMETHVVRKVKALLGLSGVRCDREMWGETIVLRPRGMAIIVFIEHSEQAS